MGTGRDLFGDITLVVIGLLLVGAVYLFGSYQGGKKEAPLSYERGYIMGEKTGHSNGYRIGYNQAVEECIDIRSKDRAEIINRIKQYTK